MRSRQNKFKKACSVTILGKALLPLLPLILAIPRVFLSVLVEPIQFVSPSPVWPAVTLLHCLRPSKTCRGRDSLWEKILGVPARKCNEGTRVSEIPLFHFGRKWTIWCLPTHKKLHQKKNTSPIKSIKTQMANKISSFSVTFFYKVVYYKYS